MKRIDSTDPNARSLDLAKQNLEKLQSLFPEVVAEGPDGVVLDSAALLDLLGAKLGGDSDEKYGLSWHGKRRARHLALSPSTGTLLPIPSESVDWQNTKNLLIEGDNLEVLKLLQKSYSGRVKLIYIDPPYNTGRNLLYPNDYQEGVQAYLEITGQAEGSARLISNPEGGGRFHTNWLSMIYPRLKLAKNLLRKDGVLVCAIDDNEQATLGLLLKEIFEEGTYEHVCVPVIHNPRGVQGNNFSYVHEYAFFVFRAGTKAISNRKIPADEIEWSQFRNWGTESERSDAKNCFYPVLVKAGEIVGFGDVCDDHFHPQQTEESGDIAYVYPIDKAGVERKWRYARQSVEAIQHLLRAKKSKSGIEIEIGKDFGLYKTVWNDKRYDANEYGTKIVGELVPGSPFTFPKSLWTVYDSLLSVVDDDPDAIVLDFFAGSGTTAHALLKINADLGGQRRFVLVQLPEPIEGNGTFKSIFDITKARVRAAASAIRMSGAPENADLGFRVFKLASSNIRAWNSESTDLRADLFANEDHLIEGRTELDVLYEILLKFGFDLCVAIEKRVLAGKDVYSIGSGQLIVCLADVVSRDEVEPLGLGIAEWVREQRIESQTTCIFRDSGFIDDVAKTNMAAILGQCGIANVRSV